ncbi:2-dehydropantoate 2-reductase [Microlunatus sagamiharensis]|uniref:2-dehydropantoate 2-reductase n=1 Tax=Microlunatus sagamiharensis TaxID=546874 RepID=A0A1H2NJ10_9ACTN|nr:2-dehydropantoate 2-reductase N-terminal domain-containing protein [Microlunatus sagamiharensis]SDV05055.1 2-dehydropantoate 2-reductase [Microlunatus sagamiharensis]
MPKRYVIIGAGAIGGSIGGRLHQAGRDVVLVARGAHLDALRRDGLRLRTPDEDVTLRVPAVGGPDELTLTEDDVLVLATKTQQVEAALPAWADAPVRDADGRETGTAGSRLPALMALNGVASEAIALRYFARVVGVCLWLPSVHLVPGEVIIRGGPKSGMLHLGSVPQGRDHALLQEVAGDLEAANFDVPLPADVMPWKYRKLISNLGNGLQALVGPKGGSGRLAAALEAEARTVLDAAGIEVTPDAEESAARAAAFTMHHVPGVPDDVGGSTWQSLQRGTGNVETDYLNGEVARIAHAHGTEAPFNARLATLVRQAAARGQQPGAVTADELAVALGLADVL